ncbi:uncharacterized protein BKA55DRAFT_546007 [Fusarium redolens]|uniref:Uncharacterized protein n=1 Tax=Fusarium redolens TaxID=48865 RepID=A0A9P9JLK7_FUSRE|nr:uncharacterized protein BKA55DRAFT_546007 [Fusarium redolens]KAH7224428.1 hypothetical protein BKA55DRAFT_546007 [Fusarium redolens]
MPNRKPRSQAPSQLPGGRAHAQQSAIQQKTGVTIAELQGMFLNAKVKFFQNLRKLVAPHYETHGWGPIHEAMRDEAALRRQGGYRSNSQTATWMPMDVDNAWKRLDGGGGPAPPSLISPPPRTSGYCPGVHVVLCGIGDPESQTIYEEDAGVGLCYNTGTKNHEDAKANDQEPLIGPDDVGIKYTGYMTVKFKSWQWLKHKVACGAMGDYLGNLNKDTTLFTHMRRPHRTEDSVDHGFDFACLNDQIKRANYLFSGDISQYPRPKEDDADMYELPGAKILHDITKDEITPPEFRFRPKVCYSQSSDYTMQDYQSVSSNSDGMGYGGKMYFHQELKQSLTKWRDISVFMVGDTIIQIAMSKGDWIDPDAHHSGFTADRCFTNWRRFNPAPQNATTEEAKKKEAELGRFVTFQ